MNFPKIVIVIQARTGSSRLPGKVLLPLCGKALLIRMVERVERSYFKPIVVVATTEKSEDDEIVDLCKKENKLFFRGSENDLLDRHYKAGLYFGADIISKIPSDCPLIDTNIIDKVISFYLTNNNKYDYVSNLHPPTFPDGNDVEVMHMSVLKIAYENALAPYEREHTTPYIWDNPDIFRIGNYRWETGKDFSLTHRFTIDYLEDYEFIKRVYEYLYPMKPNFGLNDILKLLEKKPELAEINKKYLGVNWYRHHIDSLKTINLNQTKIT
ncbi:MAG: glycosyltransferase family protein [Ignavibacteria bacterium]|nr:glycosyltransferase family protein [Ignavibacteria bacterium]